MFVNSWNSGVMRATPGNIEAPEDDAEHDALAEEVEPGQRVRGEDADDQRDDRHADADEQAVQERLDEVVAAARWRTRSCSCPSVKCVGTGVVSKV